MLFRRDILQGISEGRVTLAFRRWRRAPPADGSSLRSPVGVLRLDRVTIVDEGDITTEDVRRTGMSVAELRASIAGEGALVRIKRRVRQLKELGLTESLEVGTACPHEAVPYWTGWSAIHAEEVRVNDYEHHARE